MSDTNTFAQAQTHTCAHAHAHAHTHKSTFSSSVVLSPSNCYFWQGLCARYGNVNTEQREGGEVQGQEERGTGGRRVEEPGAPELKGNKHRGEPAEGPVEPELKSNRHKDEPVARPVEPELIGSKCRDELAERPEEQELRGRWREPAEEPGEPEIKVKKHFDKQGERPDLNGNKYRGELAEGPEELELTGTQGEPAEEPKSKGNNLKHQIAEEPEQIEHKAKHREPADEPVELELKDRQRELTEDNKHKDIVVEGPAEFELAGNKDSEEVAEEPELVFRENKPAEERIEREEPCKTSADALPASDGDTRSEPCSLELKEIPNPVSVRAKIYKADAHLSMPSLLNEGSSRPHLEVQETNTKIQDREIQDTGQDSKPEAQVEETGLEHEIQEKTPKRESEHTIPKQEIPDSAPKPKMWYANREQEVQSTISEKEILNKASVRKKQDIESEQKVIMLRKTDLIREGVLKESELQDVKEKLKDLAKHDTQYKKVISIMERLQLDMPFQANSKEYILNLIESVKMTWDQAHPEKKERNLVEEDNETREMSLGFFLQALRSKSKNSSADSSKNSDTRQEVELQRERQLDRETVNQSTSKLCAVEPTEHVEHVHSETQEEFSNSSKFVKDLPVTKGNKQTSRLCEETVATPPEVPLKIPLKDNSNRKDLPDDTAHETTSPDTSSQGVRGKVPKPGNAFCEEENATDKQETVQENRTAKRTPSRGRGKFKLCSGKRPDFDYREDPCGARPKNVFFRGRPSPEDLSIFEERNRSSGTANDVSNSRSLSGGTYFNFHAATASLVLYQSLNLICFPYQSHNLSHFQRAISHCLLETHQQVPAVPVVPLWVMSQHSHISKTGELLYSRR